MEQLAGGHATANNLAAPTRCKVWPVRSGELAECQTLKRLDGAGKTRAGLDCPASLSQSTMANLDTMLK